MTSVAHEFTNLLARMRLMSQLLALLVGKKTYLLAAAGGVVVALNLAGVIDAATAAKLAGLLGFGSVAALRSGISADK